MRLYLEEIIQYKNDLREDSNNNNWLPSPHEIYKYIESLENFYPDEIELIDDLYFFFEKSFEQ